MPSKKTTAEFIADARKVHGDRYDYSRTEYVNRSTKVKIICREHGMFQQMPYSHVYQKAGCLKCGYARMANRNRDGQEEFIAKAKRKHGSRYDYSLVKYLRSNESVKIKCLKHGVFEQRPNDHLSGKGCSVCGGRVKKTTDDYVKKARNIHADKYDYSLLEIVKNKSKITIICKTHGVFEQDMYVHLKGHGCPSCAGQEKYTTETFIARARIKHGDIYDYSLVRCNNSKTLVQITCKEHGLFRQGAALHLAGNGCPKCAHNAPLTQEKFIKKAHDIHRGAYDYSLSNYTIGKNIIKIKCKEHGIFKQSASSHLQGNGCPKCSSIKRGLAGRLNTEIFINKAKEVHGNRYLYSCSEYILSSVKIKIMCRKHGVFEQTPAHHLLGNNCPRCRLSKGELKIASVLKSFSIEFIPQKKFSECRVQRPLPFDFYLPCKKMLVEFDGEQHFNPKKFYGGESKLRETQKRDHIKNQFAAKHGFTLLRIKYTEFDRIEEILTAAIFGTETGQLCLFAA